MTNISTGWTVNRSVKNKAAKWVFEALEHVTSGSVPAPSLASCTSFDHAIGLDLTHFSVDGCCVKAPSGDHNSGPSPTDRAKSGQNRSVLTEGHGLPIGVVLAGANRHDSPLLRPTLECLSRFGLFLPEAIRVDLDSGCDSQVTRELLEELGCESKISPKETYN